MLSHLVGAANRADIRRLRDLEVEKAELEERLVRQQIAFHDAVRQRDADIRGCGMRWHTGSPSNPRQCRIPRRPTRCTGLSRTWNTD